jgi:drug/metabolite transporter (DMT)-like permease
MVNAVSLRTSHWWPYFIFAIGTLAGSAGPIVLRYAHAQGVPSPVLTAFRLTISALLFTPLVFNRYGDELRRLSRKDVLVGILAGAIFAIHFMLVFDSYRFTTILIAGVLIGAIPLWTALIERFVLHERLGRAVWGGLAISLAGGAVISLSGSTSTHPGENLLVGGALALSAAVLGAVYLIVGRSLRRHVSFVPFTWLICSSAAVVALLTLAAGHIPITGYSTEGYFWILMAAIFPQLIAHGAFNYVLAYLSPTLVSMNGQLTNVLGAAAAFFLFAELPGPMQLIGSAIIIVGVMFVIFGQTKE